MNIDELCSAFLDHALTPDQEAELFHLLSVSPEKREVLRSFGGLKEAAQKDLLSTTVPAALDQRVLAGIEAISGSASAPVAGAGAGAAGFWTARRAFVAALAAAALLTGGYVLRELSGSVPSQAGRGEGPAAVSASAPELAGRAAGRAVAWRPADIGSAPAASPARIVERRIPVVRIDTLRAAPELVVRVDTVYAVRRDTLRIVAAPELPPQRVDLSAPPAAQPEGILRSIDISLVREHQQTYPYIDYAQLGTKRMQQVMEIEAAYRFDANHALGIAFGEKVFSQEFYRITTDSLFIIQQQPSFLYGGAFYRFTLPLSERFAPQIALHAGGTSVGPVLGARLGIAFSPLAHFEMLFGGNGSLLIYKLDQNVFNSYSLGLYYGLRYAF